MSVMGRPREFDMEKALDEAMDVFWRHGYEGATIAELTAAMSINPPHKRTTAFNTIGSATVVATQSRIQSLFTKTDRQSWSGARAQLSTQFRSDKAASCGTTQSKWMRPNSAGNNG